MPEPIEERALVQAALRGDEAAWRALFDRHADAVFGFAYVRCGRNRERAEEATQEAWMIAVRKLASFDAARGTFGAWLQGIASGVLTNQNRRWARRDASELPLESARFAGRSREAALDDRLALALTELAIDHQEVIRAKYVEGLSTRAIADAQSKTPKAIESMLARARAALREAYGRHANEKES